MKKIIICILSVLCICVAGCGFYVSDYSHNTNASALKSTGDVIVEKTSFGYFFDGPGNKDALIFYPGGKVEDLSYASLLKEIAQNGMNCFLVNMPCNLAVLDSDKAQDVLDAYSYDHWYIGGHSLGGSMAASFAYKNSDQFDGLILLAAYSTKDLSQTNLKVLTIYGSNDGVLNMDKLKKYESNLPKNSETYVIKGGNHSGFGTYGKQNKDGKRTISASEQKHQTAIKIKGFE